MGYPISVTIGEGLISVLDRVQPFCWFCVCFYMTDSTLPLPSKFLFVSPQLKITMAFQLQQNESNLLRLPTEILVEIVQELRFVDVPFSIEFPYVHKYVIFPLHTNRVIQRH